MPRRDLICTSEAARILGVTRKALRAWVHAGIGPIPDRLGRYERAAWVEWAQEMKAGSSEK